jgi:hypothetical protein
MKNLIIISVLSFVLFSCEQEKKVLQLAENPVYSPAPFDNQILRQGSPDTWEGIDENQLRETWESELASEGIIVTFGDFSLMMSTDSVTNIVYYMIKARTIDGTLEMGQFLELIEDNVFRLSEKKCSCKGCPQGCELKIFGGSCSCTDCFPQTSTSTCTKTEEATVGK